MMKKMKKKSRKEEYVFVCTILVKRRGIAYSLLMVVVYIGMVILVLRELLFNFVLVAVARYPVGLSVSSFRR